MARIKHKIMEADQTMEELVLMVELQYMMVARRQLWIHPVIILKVLGDLMKVSKTRI